MHISLTYGFAFHGKRLFIQIYTQMLTEKLAQMNSMLIAEKAAGKLKLS